MYERFSDLARKVMQLANGEAQRFNHEYIATEHILLALLRVTSGLGFVALLRMDVDINALRDRVESSMQKGSEAITMGKLPQTPKGKKVIEYAMDEARRMDHNYVGTEHLLLGLLRQYEGLAGQILNEFSVTINRAEEVVVYLCSHESTSEIFLQKRNADIFLVQNHLWSALQTLDILINGFDKDVFDAAFLESDPNPDHQKDRALDQAFQPDIKNYRDVMLAKRNAVARLLGMEERHPHDLRLRDYERREVNWALECPIKIRA